MYEDTLSIIKGVMPHKRQPSLSELTPEQLLHLSRVTPSTKLPPMMPLFQMYGVPCFYRGELVAVCGKAKSGKTLFLSLIMAGCLTQKVLALNRHTDLTDLTEEYGRYAQNYNKNDKNNNLRSDETDINPLRVLWLDTEQSQQSTQDIMVNRIIPLAGGHADFDDSFFAFNLRGLGFDKRRQLTELAVAMVKPDLVIIDGIKDLVTDINDAVQATLIMEQLMALAQKHNCCIVNVLHQNKSEADHNMRGSIGTELSNKAFEVYTCEYISEHDTFKVTQKLSRREHIKRKLYYQLDDDGLPVECSEVSEQPRDAQGRWISNKDYVQTASESESSLTVAELRKLFTEAMEGRPQRPFNEVMAVALKHCGIADAKAYYACVREAEKQGVIRKKEHPETNVTWVELLDGQLPF